MAAPPPLDRVHRGHRSTLVVACPMLFRQGTRKQEVMRRERDDAARVQWP